MNGSPILLRIVLAAGPLLGAVAWWLLPEPADSPLATAAAGVAVWMAVWWLTEIVPLGVTALLPMVLFPLLGIMPGKDVASLYLNDVVFLFIGGFVVALAMEKWRLHRRIALGILLGIGGGTKRTLLGFMAATAFLSMWISNTATTMMLVPIAMAVLSRYDELLEDAAARRLSLALLLGIAYAASVGGIATLVGTPTNLVLASQFPILFPEGPEIPFARWMVFALPLTIVFGAVVWGVLSLMYLRGVSTSGTRDIFRRELREMGRTSREERTVLAAFIALALLWVFRAPLDAGSFTVPGWSQLLPRPGYIGDGTPAILIAVLLFALPTGKPGERIMDWDTAKKLPWSIVLLFGGGFALAGGFMESGLSGWIGEGLKGFASWPPMVMTAAVSGVMTFLTELTSNTATSQMVLPILGAAAVAIGRHPLFLMIPATLSASCAFMMPVATPPNAIVFGTGRLRIVDMARTGIILNLIGIVLITLLVHLVGPAVWEGVPTELPEWARSASPGAHTP